ncbi:hypothetical protein KP509_24G035400 [Ceratopteris richardii]|uniref:Uncharacterized protein n=1 Tax=Ceratopteris richardii TaxID=49495 RepID=A0A8T2RWC6_CERRI|nr:hypothetical protein KP509_24G035400 [Ceratopteris richardii]
MSLLCPRGADRMRGRLTPVTHYNLNPLHDLNTVDSRNSDIDGIGVDADQDGHPTDSLEQEDDTDSTGCLNQPYGHSPHHVVEVEDGLPLDSEERPRTPYGVLTDADVLPIEAARSRFLDLLLKNFIAAHVIPSMEISDPSYNSPNVKEKQKKRKSRDVQFEGDPKYVLPLAYIANLYETLINEINVRLATLDTVHEKTMGVALEAAGGLYRKLIKEYPKSGSTHTYKRRELASAVEARIRFPHLISGDEKRVRFVVVHGLEIVERPHLSYEDAEWFKRLTGRQEAAICEQDYKYFAPRHKYRRSHHHLTPNAPAFPNYMGVASNLPAPQTMRVFPQHQVQHQAHHMECQPDHQTHSSSHPQQLQQHLSLLSHPSHPPAPHIGEALHAHQSSPSQHVPQVMHLPASLHTGDRMITVVHVNLFLHVGLCFRC